MTNEVNKHPLDEELLDTAGVIKPEETRGSKVHVTLRLSPDLYKRVLRHKKVTRCASTTAAIEDLIRKALVDDDASASIQALILTTVRNLTAHTAHQDHILKILADRVKTKGDEKRVVDEYRIDADAFMSTYCSLLGSTEVFGVAGRCEERR